MLTLIFLKNIISLEHLKVLLRKQYRSNLGGKIFFLQNFIFYHPFESINFQPAGLLKIALIVTSLLL